MSRSFLLILVCVFSLHAQEYRSTLTGRITDPSGSAVPTAAVMAIKVDTNTRFPTVGGPEGFYTIPQLPPGTYQLTAEAPGFKKFVQSGIELASNARVEVDVSLTIGATNESVIVTADAAPLETATASAGQAITTREVENLPINGRAPMDLVVMGYAVVNTGTRDQNRPYENAGFSNFALGGAANGANETLLDGVPNTGTLGTAGRRTAFSASVDAVSEVKVQVLNVDAAYGGSGGGTVEVITKGGSNQLHGALSEFNQVSNLTATPFFTNSAGKSKTVFRQNQWGVAAGGPLFLPKIYNGRDRLFWFFTYEGQRNSEPNPTYTTVPTTAERSGDFSALLSRGSSFQLYDPYSAKLSGSTVVRQAYANNIVPASRMNPIALKYLGYVPQSNYVGNADGTNNYFAGLTNQNSYSSFSGRMDAILSGSNKLTGTIHESMWSQALGNLFGNGIYGQQGLRSIWGGMVDDVHTFTPHTVGYLRLGFSRYRAYYVQNSDGFDTTALGFPSYIAANANRLLVPAFNLNDGFLVGSPAIGLNTIDQPYNTYQLFGSVTRITGTHSLKFGGEYRVFDFSNIGWGSATGTYNFDNMWVKATSGATTTPPVGSALAAFLLGLPTTGNYNINASSKNDSTYEVLFLQDDWHVRSNLTVNLGLRWEYNGPTTERWNRQVVGFDPTATNSVTDKARTAYAANQISQLSAAKFNPVGGLLFADSDHPGQSTAPRTNFSPRLGISWSPSALKNRTVVRAGFGMFDYVYGVIQSQQPGFSSTNTYVATSDSYVSPATTLSNPFPSSNPIVQPQGASQGVNTNLGQAIVFINPSLERQYSVRWTFDIQQQIAKDTTLQVGYIGNHSVHLTTNYNFGALPAQYLSTSLVRDTDTINALSAVKTNPFAGLLSGTLSGSTISVANLLRPYPEYTGVTMNNMNNGGSYYHALAVRFSKRLSNGLVLSVNYGHSRLMDSINYLNAGSLKLEKRVANDDRPNNFTLSALYQLPMGRGKLLAGGSGRLLNTLVGRWAVSSMFSLHSGAPLAWGNVLYYGGDLQYDARNVDHAFDTTRFNTVSSQQLAQNYRTFGSQFSNMRVDGTNNLNVSVTKDFSFAERAKLQFRADSFNVCNHPLFAAPSVTATNSSFATITSQTNSPRVVQFALRLTF